MTAASRPPAPPRPGAFATGARLGEVEGAGRVLGAPGTRGTRVSVDTRPAPSSPPARHLPIAPAPPTRHAPGCPDVRPCDVTTCRQNLGTRGSESCSLDVVARGPATLEEVALAMGETPSRIRQLEEKGLRHMLAAWTERGGPELQELDDDRWWGSPVPVKRE